jgi:5,10-methylenetetrahydromethanopterin reductase
VLERHALDGDRADRIGEAIAGGDFSAAFEEVSEEMLDAFCIAGTPETVTARIEGLLTEADSVVLGSPLGPDLETAIDLACEAVRRGQG